jgi:hypothetical protein
MTRIASVESGTMATTGRARKRAARMNTPQSREASAVRAPLATLRAERLDRARSGHAAREGADQAGHAETIDFLVEVGRADPS